jgi:hypothetical protein
MKDALKSSWMLFGIASLTLGLAPFTPEPHLWGKIKWILGGAEGMQPVDWFDFLMHGAPWILLIISGVLHLKDGLTKTTEV